MVFGTDNLGFLPEIAQANLWSWIFLGAGLLGLALDVISLASPNYRDPSTFDWGWPLLFSLIGAAGFLSITIPGWLFLIGIGIVILISAIFRA